ncbi:MAG: hypothetical protein JOZ82_02135, partial [Marmoricola sp.]|nr:hypothetical protein [Marmoricola sp.]
MTVVVALSLTMFGALVSPASAAGHHPHRLHAKKHHVRVTSYIHGTTASGRHVRGVFVPKRFLRSGNEVVAQGVL